MKLVARHFDINNGHARFAATEAHDLLNGALGIPSAPLTQKEFTRTLTSALRNQADGWQKKELRYTSLQPLGRGRRRAIDFFHIKSRAAIELELGNQTVFSHDLLKLELAYRNKLIDVAVVLSATAAARHHLKWNRGKYYLTSENGEAFLRIFEPALTVPLVVLGFDA